MDPSPQAGRCVARTKSLEEANRVAKGYELEGYITKIFEKTAAGLSLYEVWVFKGEKRTI